MMPPKFEKYQVLYTKFSINTETFLRSKASIAKVVHIDVYIMDPNIALYALQFKIYSWYDI